MNTQKLIIEDIRQKVRVGCTVEERAWPQFCTFNIELCLDMTQCAKTDDVRDTVDYMAVLGVLGKLADEAEWNLIETMCSTLATELLAGFKVLQAVKISVKKSIAANTSGVTCEYEKKRI